MTMNIVVGSMLYGFCGGYFGHDSYEDKRVEAVRADWIVARDTNGVVLFANVDPVDLLIYTVRSEDADR